MKTIRHSYRPEVRITIDGTDVTKDLFGERGSVRIDKSLFAPHGEAQITFPDVPFGNDSAYGVWAPIMPVKIEMRRWQTGQTRPWRAMQRAGLITRKSRICQFWRKAPLPPLAMLASWFTLNNPLNDPVFEPCPSKRSTLTV